MHYLTLFRPAVIFALLFINGCKSMQFSELFGSYSQQFAKTRQLVNTQQAQAAIDSILTRSKTDTSYLLTLLEKAKLTHLNKDYEQSKLLFESVVNELGVQDQQAKLQISKSSQQLTALVSNDNAIEYQIPFYEQVMIHHYQALNYLYTNDLEGALVEVRRAHLVQQRALKELNLDFAAANGADNIDWSGANLAYPNMDTLIGDNIKGIDNPYTAVLSAVLLENANEKDNAYIDYKSALSLNPNNVYLQNNVFRLAKQLGMDQDLNHFSKSFPMQAQQLQSSKTGQLVLLFEQALINPKEEILLNLPVYTSKGDMRFYSVALPVYQQNITKQSFKAQIGGQIYQSQTLVDFQSLAAANLKQQMPQMMIRQLARLVTKEQIRKKMTKEGGQVGNVLAALYNITSERADTRSWLSLPANAQIITATFPENEQTIMINYNGISQPIPLKQHVNGTTLITVKATGSLFNVETSYL